MRIDVFEPRQVASEALQAYFDLSVAAFAVDRPDALPPKYEAMIARIVEPASDLGEHRYWAAWDGGALLGVAIVWLESGVNQTVAVVDLRVEPRFRRHGVGTAMFETILPELPALGRTVVTAQGVTVGGAGEKWAAFAGFRQVQQFVIQSLAIDDVDPTRWAISAPDGYELAQWTNEAPDRLLAGLAEAYNAMRDAPTGDMTFQEPEWTPARIRSSEAGARSRGSEQRTVAAIALATNEVAGITQIEVHPAMPDYAMQLDTAVLPRHRGHRLGIAMKAAMMRSLTADKPQLRRVATNTAADNAHMIRVNDTIGYRTTRRMVDVEQETSVLLRRFGSSRR